jgi:hypothetical protein
MEVPGAPEPGCHREYIEIGKNAIFLFEIASGSHRISVTFQRGSDFETFVRIAFVRTGSRRAAARCARRRFLGGIVYANLRVTAHMFFGVDGIGFHMSSVSGGQFQSRL